MLPGSETVSRLLCVGKWKIYTITTATFSTPQSQSKKGALMESWQLVEHEFETTGSNRAQTRAVSQRGRRENPGKVLGETEVAGMERVTGYPLKMKE